MAEKNSGPSQAVDPAARTILQYVDEAKLARIRRIDLNRENFDCYHLNGDFSHKRKGQSTEYLGKQQQAVEQITAFLEQGMVQDKEWFDLELEKYAEDPNNPPVLDASDWKRLLKRHVDRFGATAWFSDSLKLGLLGSLMICKVHGKMVKKSRWEIQKPSPNLTGDGTTQKVKLFRRDKIKWQLAFDLVRQEDWYPDDTGDGLYNIQGIDIDHHALLQTAENYPEDYDIEAIKALAGNQDLEQEGRKNRETNQSNTMHSGRRRHRIYECWGTILDPTTGLPLFENSVMSVTDGGIVIRKPKDNPNWHNEDPFVVCPIIRVPKSVWHRALMDSPTAHNKAMNELFNLMVDGGLMSVFGIKQVREHWLSDPNQIADGIDAGTTLGVDSSAPMGAKVLERVDTGAVSGETFQVFNAIDREFQSASLTNDVRSGTLPQRAVKATEIVASENSITGIFNGIVEIIENMYIERCLHKGVLTMAQYMDDMDDAEVRDILGEQKYPVARAMSPEERFAQIANGAKFKVFGLSNIMSRINDFRKITSLLQTISGSEKLMGEFQKEYSFTKLLGEIMRALNIDTDKIKLNEQEKAQLQQEMQAAQQQAMALAQAGAKPSKGGEPPGVQNGQSQIPQIAGMAGPSNQSAVPHSMLQPGGG